MKIAILKISCIIILMGMFNVIQAQGIEFFHGTFAEAKAKAGEENKLLFVDAYASWCGPCKWMAANTFTDAKVGTYFNENFICVKMDMEKGEGPTLANAWELKAYPTLLFFNAEGKEVHRRVNAEDARGFIKLGEKVVKKKS